jgi:hypothetical protein
MSTDVLAEPEDLREGLVLLQHRVDALEKRLAAEAHAGMPVPNLTALMPEVKRITQEVFPGPFSWNVEFDPEYPDDTYVLVNVEATGEMQDVVRRQCHWHERMRAVSVDLFGKLRLSIVPR